VCPLYIESTFQLKQLQTRRRTGSIRHWNNAFRIETCFKPVAVRGFTLRQTKRGAENIYVAFNRWIMKWDDDSNRLPISLIGNVIQPVSMADLGRSEPHNFFASGPIHIERSRGDNLRNLADAAERDR